MRCVRNYFTQDTHTQARALPQHPFQKMTQSRDNTKLRLFFVLYFYFVASRPPLLSPPPLYRKYRHYFYNFRSTPAQDDLATMSKIGFRFLENGGPSGAVQNIATTLGQDLDEPEEVRFLGYNTPPPSPSRCSRCGKSVEERPKCSWRLGVLTLFGVGNVLFRLESRACGLRGPLSFGQNGM